MSNYRISTNGKQHVHKNDLSWGVTHISDEVEDVREKENDQCNSNVGFLRN